MGKSGKVIQEDKSVPIFEAMAPFRKCERGKAAQNTGYDEEDDIIFEEVQLYADAAHSILTNRILEYERRALERSRKAKKSSDPMTEYLLKSAKREEDILPETLAAVIASEEKGLSLKCHPEDTYRQLFPDDNLRPMVQVSLAEQKKVSVIPVSSFHPKGGMMEDEDATYFMDITATGDKFEIPEAKHSPQVEYSEENDYLNEPFPSQMRPNTQANPPSDQIEKTPLDTNAIQVGSRTSELLGTTQEDDGDDFDVPLHSAAPRKENLVQLRGSVPPKWFPGYVFALPKSSDTIRVNEPYRVFELAWREFSPTKCSTPDGTVVVGN